MSDEPYRGWELGREIAQGQGELDQLQALAEQGAQQLSQYGPAGAMWAARLRSNPLAALAMAKDYGGLARIESQLRYKKAVGEGATADKLARTGLETVGGADDYYRIKAAEPTPASLELKSVIDPATGRSVYVPEQVAMGMEPTPTSSLVSIGGLNDYQKVQAQQQLMADHTKDSIPYVEATTRLASLRGLIEKLGDREPTPSESEAAATDFIKGLKPAEAVMRDDIARVLGQGFWNVVKGYFNLPQKASRQQIIEMSDSLGQVVKVLSTLQKGIDAKYQGLGQNLDIYVPGALRTWEGVPGNERRPIPIKPGTTRDQLVPGEFYLWPDGGTGWWDGQMVVDEDPNG